jgi:hypothetical protein
MTNRRRALQLNGLLTGQNCSTLAGVVTLLVAADCFDDVLCARERGSSRHTHAKAENVHAVQCTVYCLMEPRVCCLNKQTYM